jgi:hypothetical protein
VKSFTALAMDSVFSCASTTAVTENSVCASI